MARPRFRAIASLALLISLSSRLDAQLSLSIDPGSSPVSPGASATPLRVRLTVTNQGATALPDVRVEMPIPDSLRSFANASVRGGACDWLVGTVGSCDPGETLRFPIGTLEPGEGRTLGFSAPVAELPDGTHLTLAALARSRELETRAEASVVVASEPRFELELSGDREPVGVGESLTYTVHWGHVALARLAPFTRLRMVLPQGVRFVSATHDGAHSALVGGEAVDWDLGTLQPGAAGERRVRVVVDESLGAGAVLRASAEISDANASGVDASASRVRTFATTRVQNDVEVDLAFELSLDPLRAGGFTSPEAGRPIDVRLTVTNRAPFTLEDLRIEVPIPARLLGFASASVIGGACDWIVGTVGECSFPERVSFSIDALEPGAGRTVGFTAFARELPDGSTLRLEAFAEVAGRHLVETQAISVHSRPAFELALLADREPVGSGEELHYALAWSHVALDRVAVDTRLRLELPPDVELVGSSDDGTADENGDAIEWALGDLFPGAHGVRRVAVRVDAALPDGTILAARASMLEGAPGVERVRAFSTTRVETGSPLALSLEIGADPLRPGSIVDGGRALEVLATVTNQGSVALRDVRVELPLPGRLASLARASILGGTCDWISGTVGSCDHPERASFEIGDLEGGSGKSVGFFATVRELPEASVLALEAFASSGALRSRDRETVCLRDTPRFELSLTADADPTPAGSELTYTLSWGHLDRSRLAVGARLELSLPLGASLVSASRDGRLVSDVLGDRVEWTLGTLEPGAAGARTVVVRAADDLVAGSVLEARATITDGASGESAARATVTTRIEELPVEFELRADRAAALSGQELVVSILVRNLGDVAFEDLTIEAPIPDLLDAFANAGISEGSCDWIVGTVGRCEHTERVRYTLATLAPGAEVIRSYRPTVSTRNGGPRPGSIIRLRAYLSTPLGQLVAGTDVRVGEDEPLVPSGRFVRSDANSDARIDIADPVFSLNFLFLGGANVACLDAADADDDGVLRITDAIFSLNFLFLGGDAPPSPWGAIPTACGEDPTLDALDCVGYAPCDA